MEYREELPLDTITIKLEKGNLVIMQKVEEFLQSLKETGYVSRVLYSSEEGL